MPTGLRRRRARIAAWGLVALVPALFLATARWGDGESASSGDSAQYVLHARALADGRSYVDDGYLYTARNPRLGPEAYPPGLPLTLVPFVAGDGERLGQARVLLLAFFLAFLCVAGLATARATGSVVVGLGVAALAGLSLDLARHASRFVSEIPFVAFLWATIAVADRPSPWGPRRAAAVALLGSVAILYRTTGVALIPAGVVFAALAPRGRRVLALVPVVAWIVTTGVLLAVLPTGPGYLAQMPRGLAGLWRAASASVDAYGRTVAQAFLAPFPVSAFNHAWQGLALLLTLVGLVRWARAGARSFLFWFAVSYAGILFVFPEKVGRYAWPLYPVALMAMLWGLEGVVRRVAALRGTPSSPRWLLIGLAFALGAAHAVRAAREPRLPDLWDSPDAHAVAEHLRARGADRVRAVFFNPRRLTLATGIPAMGTFDGDAEAWSRELRTQGITHVVLGDLGVGPRGDRSLRAFVASQPAGFEREYANPTFEVLRLDADRLRAP